MAMSSLKISEKIKTKRKALGLTQEALANLLGVTKAAVSKWENAECYPDITVLPELAQLFHTTIDWLFDYTLFDAQNLVDRLKAAGISFTDGLQPSELREIERTFGFRFPKEIAYFLSLAYPVEPRFFNYRDTSESNLTAFCDFQERIRQSFLFDIKNNSETMHALLRPLRCTYPQSFQDVVMDALDKSPRLIPFYGHRCFFDGMDGMPIISFSQPVDTIMYGSDLVNYFENEFLCPKNFHIGKVSDRIKNTGIWYHLLE
jgi:transcriptional regulator with XRE-family HTH domain